MHTEYVELLNIFIIFMLRNLMVKIIKWTNRAVTHDSSFCFFFFYRILNQPQISCGEYRSLKIYRIITLNKFRFLIIVLKKTQQILYKVAQVFRRKCVRSWFRVDLGFPVTCPLRNTMVCLCLLETGR